MDQISRKALDRYFKIYEQIYEDPFMPIKHIVQKTAIPRSTVSRHVREMNELGIMFGPVIYLKPAQNYHQHAAFLKIKDPVVTYQCLRAFPTVISRSLASGSWNVMLTSEKGINPTVLRGFKECVLQGIKGVTWLSKVASLTWDESVHRMHKALRSPGEKSYLYEEIPSLPWDKKEWTLYHTFKLNVRTPATPALQKLGIRYEQYRKWLSSLLDVADIQVPFYPRGLDQYFMFDFLFKSDYQKQIKDILGLLPSTSLFFSVGEYILARLFVVEKRERDDLLTFVFDMEKKGYFTDFEQAQVISAGGGSQIEVGS